MYFKASPVVGKTVPLYQVVRLATGDIYLVTNNESRALAVSQSLSDSLEFKAAKYAKAGFNIMAMCLLDPKLVKTLEPKWVESTKDFEHHSAPLENGWSAIVSQSHSVDDVVELCLHNPAGVLVGRPVVFFGVSEAKRAAIDVYLRRFPKELTREIFLDN